VPKLFLPPGGRFDSPENLVTVRATGVLAILMAVLSAVILVWSAVADIGAAIAGGH
jgi:hypothetical protein